MSFPRQKAATRNFTLGAPRSFTVTADGRNVLFLRSLGGRDSANHLWVLDVASGEERILVDASGGGPVPPAELARRERMRETMSGITAYSTDDSGYHIAFALAGALHSADLWSGGVRKLDVPGPVIDPRVSPDGGHIAWSTADAVWVCAIDGADPIRLLATTGPNQVVGLADFIAAEELERHRGFWWSPQSDALLIERVDESEVQTWWIGDPAHPNHEPQERRYPAAGTANAKLELHLCSVGSAQTERIWDNSRHEYLAHVDWQDGPALISVTNRAQQEVINFELVDGELVEQSRTNDAAFVDICAAQPLRGADGAIWRLVDDRSTDTRRLYCAEQPVSPIGIQVGTLIEVASDYATVVASTDGIVHRLATVDREGEITWLTSDGVAAATRTKSGVSVRVHHSPQRRHWGVYVAGQLRHEIASLAEEPDFKAVPQLLQTGRACNTAVLFPRNHEMGSKKLPVLMHPYSGPHFARVTAGYLTFAEDQWLADQGFVVVICDGRGTPGRGPQWEHDVYLNVASVLDDQVEALHDIAARWPDDVDLQRVGIMGWSFGGWLSGLAVLKRPDVFHAAIAGAPVTEWRLYDTAYTERYLGHPDEHAAAYDAGSLLPLAADLSRPLMIIHGLADDNVYPVHTLRLSSALTAAGRAHTVLPLTGVTHMTPQEEVAENLMLLQISFFAENLR